MFSFNKVALANSVAVLIGVFYVVFHTLSLIAPTAFRFIFNAQSLGADINQFYPQSVSLGDFTGIFITIVITGWISGWLWGWLYNRFSQ